MKKKDLIPFEELMADEIEREEKINPNKYYDAKLVSVKIAQDAGIDDAVIEKVFNIKLKKKDRKS